MYLRKNVLVLFGIILFDVMSVGILIPILPAIFQNMSLPTLFADSSVNSLAWYSIVIGLHPVCAFFSAPMLGIWSDKMGRKKVLVLSMVGTVFAFSLSVVGVQIGSVLLLAVARIIDGGTAGNIAVARAALLDQFPGDNRTAALGVVGALFGLGMVLGPLIGGLDIALFGLSQGSSIIVLATLMSIVATVATVVLFTETHTHANTAAESRHKIEFFPRIERALRPHIVVGFLYILAFGMFTTYWAYFLYSNRGLSQSEISHIFVFTGLCIAITQGVIVRVLRHIDPRSIVLRSFPLMALSIILLSVVPTGYLYPAIAWFCLWNGLGMANRISMMSSYGERFGQGYVSGIDSAYTSLAAAVSPLMLGVVAIAGPFAPFWVMAVLVIVALWFVILWCRTA
jgi:DHA1 family tetracycline resistance protein-like MFS transporter